MSLDNKFKLKFSSQSLGKISQDDVKVTDVTVEQFNTKATKIGNQNASKTGKIDKKSSEQISTESIKTFQYFETVLPKQAFIGSIHSITSNDIVDNLLLSNIEKSLLEDTISEKFSQSIIDKSKLSNEKFFNELNSKIEKEFQSSLSTLLIIESLYNRIENFNSILLNTNVNETIRQKFKIENEPFTSYKIDNIRNFLKSFLNEKSKIIIDNKTNTAVINQLLKVVTSSITKGYTSAVFNKNIIEETPQQDANSLVDVGKSNRSDLRMLSKESNRNFVLGLSSNFYSYVDLEFYPLLMLNSFSKDTFAISLISMICNEMTYSAGIGRLDGTTLGNRFGSNSTNFVDTLFGVEYLQTADAETAQSNSLNDFFVISQTGNRRVENINSKRVMLFEGSNFKSSSTVTNAYDEFIKTILQDPQKNKFNIFNDSLVKCISTLDESIEFIKKASLKDSKCNLLLQTNLYARILSEVSTSMAQFSSKSSIDKNSAAELCLMKHLSNSFVYDSKSNVGKIKNFILSLIVKKSANNFLKTDYNENIQQSGKKTSTSTNVKITKKGDSNSGNKVDEFIVETSQNDASNISNYDPTNDTVKFCNETYEKNILLDFSDEILSDLSIALTSFSYDVGSNQADQNNLYTINSKVFIDYLLKSNDSIISKISRIFVDLCNEALEKSRLENSSSSWIDSNRLSKNSKLNGALLCSMLFESTISIIDVFFDGKITKLGKDTQTNKAALIPGLLSLIKIDNNLVSDVVSETGKFEIHVSSGKQSLNSIRSKALLLLSQGISAGTFSSIINSDGFIASLDLFDSKQKISETLSFNEYVSNVTKLSNERDVVNTILLSIRSYFEEIYQQTRTLNDITDSFMKQNSQDVTTFIQFSKKDYGSRYLKNISKSSIDISKKLHDKIKNEISSTSYRSKRITQGQVNCIKVLLEGLKKTNCANYNFFSVFLPNNFVKNFEDFNKTTKLKVSLSKYASITKQQFLKSEHEFSTEMLFDDNAFDEINPNAEDEIYGQIKLKNGSFGASLIGTDLQILKNEIKSFLFKKLFALTSLTASDEYSIEENRNDKYISRSSKQIMSLLLSEASLSNDFFDRLYIDDNNGTRLNSIVALDIKSKSNISFGKIDVLFDLYNTIYFKADIIEKSAYIDNAFDKCYVICTNDLMFSKVSNDKNQINGSIKQNYRTIQDQPKIDNETVQKTIDINEYSVTITKVWHE